MRRRSVLHPVAPWLVAAALAASTASAQPLPPPPGAGPDRLIARHAAELGLDTATREAIEAIVVDAEAESVPLHERLRAAHERMRALLESPETDRAAVMAQAGEIEGLMGEAQRRRLDTILRIHERLTPAQRAALVRIAAREGEAFRPGPLGLCDADLRRLCADATDGPAALRCLAERWSDVSAPCQAAIEGGGDLPPPPGPTPPM